MICYMRYYLKTGTISKPNVPKEQMCDCHSSYDTEAVIMKRLDK